MAERSHRDEMNAAIRAQRERQAAPRTIAPVSEPAPAQKSSESESAEPPHRSMLDRLRGR